MRGGFLMKQLITILLIVFCASICFAGSKTLQAEWQQEIPAGADLAGWKFYKGTVSGGPYALEKTINFVSAQSVYTDSVPVIVPDNAVTNLYFVLTAFDVSGNESVYSNEANIQIDFMPPSSPFQFKFKIVTQ
jgi:hypothetical protein